jgi:hypothetical protein
VFFALIAIWTFAAIAGTVVLLLATPRAATLPVQPKRLVGMIGSQVVFRRLDGTLAVVELAEPVRTQ